MISADFTCRNSGEEVEMSAILISNRVKKIQHFFRTHRGTLVIRQECVKSLRHTEAGHFSIRKPQLSL